MVLVFQSVCHRPDSESSDNCMIPVYRCFVRPYSRRVDVYSWTPSDHRPSIRGWVCIRGGSSSNKPWLYGSIRAWTISRTTLSMTSTCYATVDRCQAYYVLVLAIP